MMEQSIIPDGYKKTEFGLIPDDWEDAVIGDVATFVGGSQPAKSTFKFVASNGYIRLIQIRDYKKDTYITFIPEHLAQKKCESDDIMIGRYGPPIFQILRGIKGAYNVALIKSIPNEKVIKDFLYYTLKSEGLFQVMEILSRRSSGQTGVDLPALKSYPLALPPLKEQAAIANTLSNIDGLIASIEKLIVKKQAIKTATMQQLLTGKKRLPPFDKYQEGPLKGNRKGTQQTALGIIPKDWDVKSIGELASVSSGGTPNRENKNYWGGDIPWVTTTLIKGKEINTAQQFITVEGLNNSATKWFEKGTILIAMYGQGKTRGKVAILGIDATINQACAAISINSDDNPLYILHFLNNQYKAIRELSNSGGQENISGQIVKSILVPLPPNKEQKVICSVLSDMDLSIDSLKDRLAKTKQIKQGMMKELLTGKTRLPVTNIDGPNK